MRKNKPHGIDDRALALPCPYCDAPVGEPCIPKGATALVAPHVERVYLRKAHEHPDSARYWTERARRPRKRKVRKVTGPLTVPCVICGAGVGRRCVGTTEPHAVRSEHYDRAQATRGTVDHRATIRTNISRELYR